MSDRIINRADIPALKQKLKADGKIVVFTNGCFDILHAGHIDYLNKAKNCGDILIVALNSDKSIKKNKGELRPIIPENERALIMSNLRSVDYVTLFDEETPEKLLTELLPDVLVKGADWKVDQVVGRSIVETNGGRIERINIIHQQSTSKIINKILEVYKK